MLLSSHKKNLQFNGRHIFWKPATLMPKNIHEENSTQEYQFWNLKSFSKLSITTENYILTKSENHIPPNSPNQPLPAKNTEFIFDLRDEEHIQQEREEGAFF